MTIPELVQKYLEAELVAAVHSKMRAECREAEASLIFALEYHRGIYEHGDEWSARLESGLIAGKAFKYVTFKGQLPCVRSSQIQMAAKIETTWRHGAADFARFAATSGDLPTQVARKVVSAIHNRS
jgi:hypothetical protein